jgi:hypothetical protein
MPGIQFSAGTYSTPSNAIRLQNFLLTYNAGGPTSQTGYWTQYPRPSNGWVIYINKATQGPSIYACNNDTDLVNSASQLSNTTITSVDAAINYFNNQTDKIIVGTPLPNIPLDGLQMYLDAGIVQSYNRTGTTWNNLIYGNANGTLVNGPSFSSGDGGSIVFDGVDDYASCNFTIGAGDFTFNLWIKKPTNTNNIEFVMGRYADITVRGAMLYFNGGTLRFRLGGSPSGGFVESNLGNITDGIWKNITCSVTRTGNMISYINGVPAVTTDASTQQGSIANGNFIGGFVEIPSWVTSGNLAIVSSYTKALSASEVLQNYNATKGRFGL